MNSSTKTDVPHADATLEVCELGRPVHRLGAFSAQLGKDFAEALRNGLNRRYRAAFEVRAVSLDRANDAVDAARWTAYSCVAGRISFAAERLLILTVLRYRYGLISDAPSDAPAPLAAVERETATEERVALALGEEFAALIAARVAVGNLALPLDGIEPAAFTVSLVPPPAAGTWTITCTVSDAAMGAECRMWFALDEVLMDSLLRGLVPVRDKKDVTALAPFATRLQMKMTGRLLSKEIQLGDLLDLRVGDVIPVFIGDADVLVDDSPLFTAAVAEHKGKLCLTSFDDRD